MKKWSIGLRTAVPLVAVSAGIILFGCGGSATVPSGSAPGSTHPSAKTYAHAGDLLTAYGQGIATNSFVGYGPRLQTKSKLFFDPVLGLYVRIRVAPDGIFEILYQDSAASVVAGNLSYAVFDITLSINGTISITDGRFAGLTGYYNDAYISTTESNGDINYSVPNGATTVSQFDVQSNASEQFFGNATIGVTLQDGYGQTELVTYVADGSETATSTDTNAYGSKMSFASDMSGIGTITGADPGLPAKVTWSSAGTGAVTFADGSTAALTVWQLTGPPSGSGLRR